MRHGRRIRSDHMKIVDLGDIVSRQDEQTWRDRMTAAGWRLSMLPAADVARHGTQAAVLLESGFLACLDEDDGTATVRAALLACEDTALRALADASLECLDRWRIRPADALFRLRRFRLHETIRARYNLPVESDGWRRMLDGLQALADMREAENRYDWHPFDVTANLTLGVLAVFSALGVADQIITRLGGSAAWTVILGLLALATIAIVWRLNRAKIRDWLHQTSALESTTYRPVTIPMPAPDKPADTSPIPAAGTVSDTTM